MNEPAFPITDPGGKTFYIVSQGMTLRDYFAAQALCLLANDKLLSGLTATAKAQNMSQVDTAANFAYGVAEAMLEARREAKSG